MIKKTELKKVLIIDDDESTNFLTEIYFEDSGLAVELIFKTSAESALEYLKNNEGDYPELIFLDINLPIMNGWEFLEVFLEGKKYCEKQPKIFMCSTSVFIKDKEKSKDFCCVMDYIEKPLTMQKILNIKEKYFL